jgi:ribose-phosphate pyrophosphokinase
MSVGTGTNDVVTLPGLATVESVQPSPERGHWIQRGPEGRLMLFSGRSNRGLAEAIAEKLNIELGDVDLRTFENGEVYCRFGESIRGADVFIVQSCAGRATNDHLWELLVMIDAAKLASANRITAVMPWYPYSRQDKKSAPREPVTAKLVAACLERAGVDRVLTMDLHAGQIQGFFSIPVDHMTALPLFAQYYRDKGLWGDCVVAVAPDPGRGKMTTRFAEFLEADVAYMSKTRPEHDVAEVTEVVGRDRVRGKTAILTDDLIVTGSTLVSGARALKEAGAKDVYACATHGLFPPKAVERLAASEIAQITVTDTVPQDPLTRPAKLEVVPVAGLLADTIQNVFCGDSVSAIFAGENQLF